MTGRVRGAQPLAATGHVLGKSLMFVGAVGLVVVLRRGSQEPSASDEVFATEFPAERACVPDARRRVREWLEHSRGGEGAAVDELELVVSELVTNSVLYSGAGSVVVSGRRSGGVVRLDIRDGGRFVPPDGAPDLLATGGRGLLLVDALVEGLGGRWACVDGVGVWIEVPVPEASGHVNSLREEA